ncbi:hypothetical protein FHP05_02320 [Cerasibacillus terrae]|uniref:Uncharacterized protein n=1 Tax=Cerasibacillus terrae TaxID=2498845 RepID=A0A5C8P3L9_9BACI|nr:hypothetical protein [Cerasibacillus terrae]TXL67877.1 hypothetical protein FHP05_02320 [Cerasibacillus terrae]
MVDSISNDQATTLRNLVDKNEGTTEQLSHDSKEREIDVLNLPPRSVVHQKHTKTYLKLSKPLLRLVFVFFVLLVVFLTYFLVN